MKRGRQKAVAFFVVTTAIFLFFANCFATNKDDIVVSGIMHDKNSLLSRAIVNGSIVKVGDKISDAEIVAIKSESVVVRRDGSEEEISPKAAPSLKSPKTRPGGFWQRLVEKITSFGRKKKELRPSEQSGGGENYLKAITFYMQAEDESDLRARVRMYQAAIKHAQYSLELEFLDSQKNDKLRKIIEDSRLNVNEFSEKADRTDEMNRLFFEGRKYKETADDLSSYDAASRAKKRENYSLALQYFHKAYDLAQEERDKAKIESKIADIESEIEQLGRL